jgi:replicative DNA helicase
MSDISRLWNEEAEVCTLGGCLIDADALVKAAAILKPEHFAGEPHRLLFRAMLQVAARGTTVDPITLQAELGSRHVRVLEGGQARTELEVTGGLPYLGELLDAVPTADNIESYARIVRDHATRRQMVTAADRIASIAQDPQGRPVDLILDEAQQLMFGCAGDSTSASWRLSDALQQTFEQIEKMDGATDGLTGITTGFPAVDFNTGGLQRGDLVLIAGRPSMGKTAFGVTALALAAAYAGHGVLINSLEMSRTQITARMLCHEALVDIMHVLRGQIEPEEYQRLARAAAAINKLPIRIHEGLYTVAQLRAEARRTAVDFEREGTDLGLVIVDYIGQMDGEGENQNLRVGSISKGLKRLAKDLKVPVVALSQLSRAPQQRADHRPQLSDLRDSGNLEQDADVVGFLHRPEYYVTREEAQEKNIVGKAEFIIGKQRNGPTGPLPLYFRASCARFEEYEQRDEDAPTWGVPVKNGKRRHARR